MYNIAGLKLEINSYQDPMIHAFAYGNHGKIIHSDAALILVWTWTDSDFIHTHHLELQATMPTFSLQSSCRQPQIAW